MPRPSLKTQRVAQILDAYEICVAKYGVDGATLERIAAEAGLARPLIRHNIGNRDDLLEALTTRFLEKSERDIADLMDRLPEEDRGKVLVSYLFDHDFEDTQTVLVANAFMVAAPEYPFLLERMRTWSEGFIHAVEKELQQAYPQADVADVYAVATGITGIYFNVDSLSALGDMKRLRQGSKKAALMLIETLG